LVHPQWLKGSDVATGGSAQDSAKDTEVWDQDRASNIRLLEVRGKLPDLVTCPETKVTFAPEKGVVPKKSHFSCGACGTVQDVLTSIKATKKTGAMAAYAIQAYSPKRDAGGAIYGGRYFAPYTLDRAKQYAAAFREWEERKEGDLKDFWPRSELPYGFMTHRLNGGIPNHGFTHWHTMFNPRQLLVHAQLLKAIVTVGGYAWDVREFVLGAFQNYIRQNNDFCFWHIRRDCVAPSLSNNNFHPKSTVVESSAFLSVGCGNWASCTENVIEGKAWCPEPWELVSAEGLKRVNETLAVGISGKSAKVYPGDAVLGAELHCSSSTDLVHVGNESLDLVITDPPFGGLLHYSELSDFFYVWLRLALKEKYPNYFGPEYTPKALEVVANSAREPEDPNGYYKRLLTTCWREAHRALKPSGILAFTFHHSEDEPWVAVLESLFDAGFYLAATYPLRSDETKGEGQFGSRLIEFDIIHVCRKRMEEIRPVSWPRMRREVLSDVGQLKDILENHAKGGLGSADLQVIKRGKALEYYSRHYGKVMQDEENAMSVADALVGINLLLNQGGDESSDGPPKEALPTTWYFLKIFGASSQIDRDQMQKFLRGTGVAPNEFIDNGWCSESNKVFIRTPAQEFAKTWVGRHRDKLTRDLDQALVIIGACFDGSGMNAEETLKNPNFRPKSSLGPLLEWFKRKGPDEATSAAADRALYFFNKWKQAHAQKQTGAKGSTKEGWLFGEEEI
jgi:hypothetical protein